MFGKKLSKYQLENITYFQNLIRDESIKLELVNKNTVFVPNHKDWTKTQEGLIKVLTNYREELLSKYCHDLGITGPISLDLTTGKITIKDGQENSE